MRVLLLAAVLLSLSACDRTGLDDPMEPMGVPGTFEATVRQIGGSGFEDMTGTAVFSSAGADAFVVRLASPLSSGTDTTRLDLVVTPGEAALREGAGLAALCYRSPVFQDGPYRGESGTLASTVLSEASVDGTIDGTAFVDLQTGPTTTNRVRVSIEGTFQAIPGAPRLDAEAVRQCASG